MNWVSDNATFVALGLFIFFGVFVAAFFIRNQSAKTDEEGAEEKKTRESTVGIKTSKKL